MHQTDLITTLIHRRNVLRITQQHLAELSGVGLRTLKAIESGTGNPTVATLVKLADVLGMKLQLTIKQPGHSMRQVAVYRNNELAGYLTEEDTQHYVFRYAEGWLADAHKPAISLTLPKSKLATAQL